MNRRMSAQYKMHAHHLYFIQEWMNNYQHCRMNLNVFAVINNLYHWIRYHEQEQGPAFGLGHGGLLPAKP